VCGGVFYAKQLERKAQAEREPQRVRALYGQLLTSAKDAIRSKNIQAAIGSLKQAVALPDTVTKTEAANLLRDAEIVATPLDSYVQGLSAADLAAICKSRTFTPAYDLSYAPLVELHQEKVTAACDAEVKRRQELVRGEHAKAEAERRERIAKEEAAARESAAAKAASTNGVDAPVQERARLNEVPNSLLLSSSATSDWLQLAGRGGVRASGKVMNCDDDNIFFLWNGIAQTHTIDETEDIHFARTEADLMLRLVKASLRHRNGVVAYKVAFLGRNTDGRLSTLALDRDFSETTLQVLAARARALDLRKKIAAVTGQKDATERCIAQWEQYQSSLRAYQAGGAGAQPREVVTTESITSRVDPCATCGGDGRVAATPPALGQVVCPTCRGKRKIQSTRTDRGSALVPAKQPSPPNLPKSLAAYRQDSLTTTNTLADAQKELAKTETEILDKTKTLSEMCPTLLAKWPTN
jgi:hypothetical protein